MNRRNFISLSSIGSLCGAGVNQCSRSGQCFAASGLAAGLGTANFVDAEKPIDTKIRLKPVFISLVHSATWEGPCRWDPPTVEQERRNADSHNAAAVRSLKKGLTKDAVLLDPVTMYYDEGTILGAQEWKKLQPDASEVDVYLNGGWPAREPGIGRFQKPVISMGTGPSELDIAAGLKARGVDAHAVLDMDELNQLISRMRVRKAVRQTRVLVVTDRRGLTPVCGLSGPPLEEVRSKLGVDSRVIGYKEFFDAMDKVSADKTAQDQTREMVKGLTARAAKVHLPEKDIGTDVLFYLTTKSLMNQYGCNAFTIDCIELCASQIPAARHFTPCLTHTMLKDQGMPSSCEGDMNALLAMMLATYTCRKSCLMGNPTYDKRSGTLRVGHDVPGLKMKGLDGPDLPFELRNFVRAGWGTTFRYDFKLDKGQPATVTRFDPTASKVLLAKGIIEDGVGFDQIGCTLRVVLRVPKLMDLYHAHAEFGQHLAVIYGDCVQEIRQAAEFMKVGVVEVS